MTDINLTAINKYIALILFYCVFNMAETNAQAPDLDDVSFRELKVTAKNADRLGDTYSALYYYKEWLRREPDNLKVSFKTAELYRISRDYKNAEKQYKEVLQKSEAEYSIGLFHLANVQMTLGKYKDAKENFEKFKPYVREFDNRKYRKLMNRGLESCDYALHVNDSSKEAIVSQLKGGINQAHIEFSPIPYDENTLIYGSLREKGLTFYDKEQIDSNVTPKRKYYVAVREGEEWVSKGELTGPFNQEGVDVGNAVIRQDGSRIYFTLCQKNWQNKVICHLYYADKKNKGWGEIVKMNDLINLANYTTTQPAIGIESKKSREVIYFASDRPGGKGEMDIWYTEYRGKNNSFKSPRNLGSKINTVGTEATPYYDLETHRLYFSSNGMLGFGGLDVYKSIGEKNKWEDPQHLGKDINSPADDFDFVIHPDRKSGFMVSNRKGGKSLLNEYCCDDIYEFRYIKHIDILLKGTTKTEKECLDNVWLKLYIKGKEGSDKYLSRQMLSRACDFKFKLEPGTDYVVEMSKEGFFTETQEISTKNVKASKEFTMDFDAKRMSKEAIAVKGIEYEFNSPELTDKAKESIDASLFQIMTNNPGIKIEIGAHTDSKGTEAYNKNLSEKRANSVVKYLAKKGISPQRLIARGYGESQPIAPNEKADGSDNPEGRALNRRTEFKVIGEIKQKIVEEED